MPLDQRDEEEAREEAEPKESLTVRLPQSIRRRIKAVAVRGGVSETYLVKKILKAGLPEWERVWKVSG